MSVAQAPSPADVVSLPCSRLVILLPYCISRPTLSCLAALKLPSLSRARRRSESNLLPSCSAGDAFARSASADGSSRRRLLSARPLASLPLPPIHILKQFFLQQSWSTRPSPTSAPLMLSARCGSRLRRCGRSSSLRPREGGTRGLKDNSTDLMGHLSLQGVLAATLVILVGYVLSGTSLFGPETAVVSRILPHARPSRLGLTAPVVLSHRWHRASDGWRGPSSCPHSASPFSAQRFLFAPFTYVRPPAICVPVLAAKS